MEVKIETWLDVYQVLRETEVGELEKQAPQEVVALLREFSKVE